MGAGWRRLKERVRESIPGTAGELTSNARNKMMMKTATDFSAQVRKCERAIRTAQGANAELLSTTKATMTLPLPNTYEDSNAGAGSATSSLNLVGGPHFKADTVGRVTNESGHKLETEVLAPLTRWQDVHLQLAARYKDLENTRLELDSRRRTVTELSSRVSAMRARLGAGGGGAKPEAKLDATIRTLSHKEAKLKVTTQNFEQQESLLARDLAALIADGQYLKHYVAAALRLQGGALLGAADAFGELTSAPTPPPPVVASPVGTPTRSQTDGGAVGFAVPSAVAPMGMGAPSRTTSDASNPYHSQGAGTLGGGAVGTGTLPMDRPAVYSSNGSAGSAPMGSSKRYSEPETMVLPDVPAKSAEGMPAARFPVAEQPPAAASDNPYSSVRGYNYA
ncbi:hypothetical protein D9Q98_006166 [Chlorella vulgaris]|uniref:Uncharacterized protein n=1 Tax=Chlorella vulgaris TaxID=3077 RepID=A0A9D4Z0M0_CHLVU|nr:hypothetical protein D9Q98_006166 [Chlorella vulgaris]